MLTRTRWRVVEEPCEPEAARARWRQAQKAGAVGGVSSWASGIPSRKTLRIYWEVRPVGPLPEGEDLIEENWTPYWRKSLGAVAVTESFVLVPAWSDPPPGFKYSLRIDPGMAFGAGDHPTTRICVRMLEHLAASGILPLRVLDVGAGTGVLSFAAALLGSPQVDALDIDPFGYAATRRNAQINGLERMVRPVLLSLDLVEGSYPLVIANIPANQIVALADILRTKLEPESGLLLSGFQKDAMPKVLDALGLDLKDSQEEEGWVGLRLWGRTRG